MDSAQPFQWTDLGPDPLVSCIMPTYGRPKLVPESVRMFLRQDYPHKELILLNDCPGQEYVLDEPDVRVINAPSRYATLGEKRNACVELARGGLIAVWDDDDVYLPWRLSYSVRRMLETRTPLYLASEYWAYWGEEELHDNQATLDWISHPQALFRKDLWERVGRYPHTNWAEDRGFFLRVLEHLGVDWFTVDIDQADRFLIMRGTSAYAHTSIGGGRMPPETTAGRIDISPCPIDDPVLRRAADRLIMRHEATMNDREQPPWFEAPLGAADNVVYLDDLRPASVRVGYGELGLHGGLGYEDQRVRIGDREFPHALGTHAPAVVTYAIDGGFDTFSARVAINDDVPVGASSADFLVLADERLAGVATNVQPRSLPRAISADVRGATDLKLVVRHHRWEYCHAVWGAPRLERRRDTRPAEFTDCLRRAWILIPERLPEAETCIATVGSPGFEDWIDDLFGSVRANAHCPEARLAVFFFDVNDAIRGVADKYDALLIPCRAAAPLGPASKSVLYSAGRVIRASRFICLDADMLVLDDLRPILGAIESHPPGAVLACREALWVSNLEEAAGRIYGGKADDISRIMGGCDRDEGRYELIVNDGLFAGSRAALCGVDELIRAMPNAIAWMQSGPGWRNQFVFNLALAHLRCGVELDGRFNVQLNSQQVEFEERSGVPAAAWNGQRTGVLHFNGCGRGQHRERRGLYRRGGGAPVPV